MTDNNVKVRKENIESKSMWKTEFVNKGKTIPDVLIVPLGFTPSYQKVTYHFNNKSIEDWLSSRALLKLKYDSGWNAVDVIVIYPDNESAEKSVSKGWKKGDLPKIKEDIESVKSVFKDCRSLHLIKVSEESEGYYVGEQQIANLMIRLQKILLDLLNIHQTKLNVIYDLTHSFRHIAFGALLQAIYIQDLTNNSLSINEIYYAFGKAPIKANSKLYYLNLSSFIELVKDTGVVTNAIDELRPKEIMDLSIKFKRQYGLYKGMNLDFKYLKWVSDQTGSIADLLLKIQLGLCNDKYFTELENKIQENYANQIISNEIPVSIFYNVFIEKLRDIMNQFRRDDSWIKMYEKQIKLAEISYHQQYDLAKSYSFMRESCISYFIDAIYSDSDGGSKSERENIEYLLKMKLKDLQNKKLVSPSKEFFQFYNTITDYRNNYDHVYSGKINLDVAKIGKILTENENHLIKIKNYLEDKDLMSIITKDLQSQGG